MPVDNDDDGLAPLGEGTVEALEQVKKGKPRNFLLVCKGAKVKYLVVRKKAIKKKDVAEAKSQGYKGEPSFGVLMGKGLDLVFTLARADGYDGPPTKDKAVKEFLEEHAEFKCKPTFEIVDTLPAIPFDEDQLQHPLVARFVKVEQAAGKVQQAQPERREEIQTRLDELRELLQEAQYEPASPRLDELVNVLKQLSSATAPPVAPPTPGPGGAEFMARLKAVKPELDRAIAAGGARGEDLKTRSAAMGTMARNQQFAQALAALAEIETLLQTPPSPPEGDPSAAFLARLKTVKPELDKVVAGGSPQAQQLKGQAAEMGTLARAKDFTGALTILEAIARQLATAGTSPPEDFTKAWPTAKAAWQDASDQVDNQISRLQAALRNSNDDELVEIAEFGLNGVTGNFKVPLLAAIRDVDNAAGENRGKAASRAASVVEKFKQHLLSDERVAAVDENPFKISVTVRGTLVPALDQLAGALRQLNA